MASFYEEIHKSDSFSDEKENAVSRKKTDTWIFRLLLVLVGFMPLIVLASTENVISPLVTDINAISSGIKGELFTHFKAIFMLIITVIAGVMLLAKISFMGGTIKKNVINYFLGIFAVVIVASTIFSPNITLALNGQYNRSDGAISWLCYVALLFIAMNIEYPKKAINYVMYAMMPFVYINVFIMAMNFYGKDLMQYAWMQKLVSITLPEGASISEGSTLVGTLNQWNFMSGMFAVITVMYLAWTFIEKSWVSTILGAVTAATAMTIVFMSISTSGFLTVVVSIIVLLVIFMKSNVKKQSVSALAIFIVVSAPLFHVLASENDKVWNESFGFIVGGNPYEQEEVMSALDTVFIHKAYAAEQAFDLPVLPEKGWAAGTGRMYIWEKAFDLVKDRPLVGYGLDTFAYNFPHFNIDARGGNNSENTIVDKPHSLYVGVLYGTGIIGAIALVLIIFATAITGVKAVIGRNQLSVAVLVAGCFAFFIQALFNDSIPSMTTFAFVMIGMIMSMTLSSKVDTEQE